MDVVRRWRAGLCSVLLAFMLPSAASAQGDSGDVRFAVMGNRELDGTITGEIVQVYVPWEGVNATESTVRCLIGPFQLRSDGAEERARIGPNGAVLLRLRLESSDEGTWEVAQANGPCATLGGTGSFRRTLWDDGAVSYRFIGEARIAPLPSATSFTTGEGATERVGFTHPAH